MGLKNIYLKQNYDSDRDDVLNNFYIPILSNSLKYKRLAGFFSSTSLAVASKGISDFIKKNGHMQLVCSAKLQKEDVNMIQKALKNPEEIIEKSMLEDLNNLEEGLIKDHVSALGWMIANKKLEIKIAILTDENGIPKAHGMFHPKKGILIDNDENKISFDGSINESVSGWYHNIESFKVFCSWKKNENEYIILDEKKFDEYWNNNAKRAKVIDIPTAVKEKLIQIAPKDIEKLNLKKWYQDQVQKNEEDKLRDYQKEAIEKWLANNKKGIFEMATGTGKTFTALGCLDRISSVMDKLLTIICCPTQQLVQQWKNELYNFNIEFDSVIIADSSNSGWKSKLYELLTDIFTGYRNKIIILTTHQTFSSKDFRDIIIRKKDSEVFLIADEVHGLGAGKRKEGLLEEYELRLGLSATPKRWYDDIGTELLYNYFQDVVFEFDIEKAISCGFLTPYKYIPRFTSLSKEEIQEYYNKTRSIALNYHNSNEYEKEEILTNLRIKRSKIVKNAANKYQKLEEILDELGDDVKLTIIYCDPKQIDNIMEIMRKRRIKAHRFTSDEGTIPKPEYNGLSQRDYLLQEFANCRYQILVAMKCLDEGIDIPPARKAILMASSGNPREYIQRIGRLIRKYPGKTEAILYDIIIIPSLESAFNRKIELEIFEKELERYEKIAEISKYNSEAFELIYNIRNALEDSYG